MYTDEGCTIYGKELSEPINIYLFLSFVHMFKVHYRKVCQYIEKAGRKNTILSFLIKCSYNFKHIRYCWVFIAILHLAVLFLIPFI